MIAYEYANHFTIISLVIRKSLAKMYNATIYVAETSRL